MTIDCLSCLFNSLTCKSADMPAVIKEDGRSVCAAYIRDPCKPAQKIASRTVALKPKLEDDGFYYDNGSHTETQHDYWLACPICGEPVAYELWDNKRLYCDYCPHCGQKIDNSEVVM